MNFVNFFLPDFLSLKCANTNKSKIPKGTKCANTPNFYTTGIPSLVLKSY